jgi:hypothetical protein
VKQGNALCEYRQYLRLHPGEKCVNAHNSLEKKAQLRSVFPYAGSPLRSLVIRVTGQKNATHRAASSGSSVIITLDHF